MVILMNRVYKDIKNYFELCVCIQKVVLWVIIKVKIYIVKNGSPIKDFGDDDM